MKTVTKAELMQLLKNRRIYILTSFNTAVLCHKKDLIAAMPKDKTHYSIDLSETHILIM
jgi:hypothetical protein